ncbi:MAG: hypothetical protein AB8B89_03055 [Gammaproteobacteria bacterium]
MIGLFIGGLIAMLFPLLCIIVVAENFLPFKYRRLVFVVSAMLLLTPSWGPATIVYIPIPFGMLLSIGIFSGELQELFDLVALYGWWHCIAFSITGILSWLISRRLFKPEFTTNA